MGVSNAIGEFFEVVLSRSQATAKALIGEAYEGIVTSDRYSAYTWIELSHWQVCWAHLKRDLTAIAEREGASQEIGEALHIHLTSAGIHTQLRQLSHRQLRQGENGRVMKEIIG